jgi:hypothetical protein
VLGVDEPDRGAVGAERAGEALAGRAEERVEIDLASEERGKIDDQRQARHG